MPAPAQPLHVTSGYVRGALSGVPDRESAATLSLIDKLGSASTIGLYETMVRTWPYLASRLLQWRASVGALQIEAEPLPDETPEETRWAEIFDDLLRRVVVEQGDGRRVGLQWYMQTIADVLPYGVVVLGVRWEHGRRDGADDMETDRIILTPLPLSSMRRWVPAVDPVTGAMSSRPASLVYTQGDGAEVSVDYGRLIHLTWDAPPTAWFGSGVLRSLVATYNAAKQTMLAQQRSQAVSGGVLRIHAGLGADTDERREQISTMADNWASTGVVVIPDQRDGQLSAEVVYPTGSQPDWGAALAAQNSAVDALWGTEALSLGSGRYGTHAAASAMERRAAVVGDQLATLLTGMAIGSLWDWVMSEERPDPQPRMRQWVPMGEDVTDTGETVTRLASAVSAGLVQWTTDDEDRLRTQLDLGARAEPAGPPVVSPAAPPSVSRPETPRETVSETLSADDAGGRVVVLCGPPGAGKSTHAMAIARTAGEPVVSISPDAHMWVGDGDSATWDYSRRREAIQTAYRELDAAMSAGVGLIIYESPLLTRRARASVLRRIVAGGYTPEVVSVTAPAAEVIRRDALRPPTRRLSPEALRAMVDAYQPPTEDEGWASVRHSTHAPLSVPEGAQGHGRECGCGSTRCVPLATDDDDTAGDEWQIVGSDGEVVEHYRPALAIEVRPGVTVRPELWVAWQTDVRAQRAREERLRVVIEEEVERTRDAVRAAAASGATIGEIRAGMETAQRQGTRALVRALTEWLTRTRASISDERERTRQAQPELPRMEGADPDLVARVLAGWQARLDVGLEAAAESIMARTVGEMVRAWSIQSTLEGWVPQRTIDSMVREVLPIARAEEARSAGALEGIPPGKVITAVVRVSTKQSTVCRVCRRKDGATWRLPEQLDEFERDQASDLPDMECTSVGKTGGVSLCECALIYVYADRAVDATPRD